MNGTGRSEPRSILFIHSADEAFGSDRVLLALVDLARSREMVVRVLLPDDTADGWLSRQLRDRRIEVTKGPLAPARRRYFGRRRLAGYGVGVVNAARFLRSEVGKWDPDVIHVNTSTVIAAGLLGRRNRGRLVWHVHEVQTTPRIAGWILRVVPVLAADDVIAISVAVRCSLPTGRLRRATIHTVFDSLPPRPCAPSLSVDDGKRRCVFAGRISERKGYDVFVDAAADIASDFPSARFLLAGVPPPGEEWRMEVLHRQLALRGIADRTDVLGMCDDLGVVFDRSDIAVFPSRLPEGFGLAMAEAMRSRCAVISSGHGAAREIVINGVTGLLVAAGDRRAVADALRRLLDDASLRQRLATQGRDHVLATFTDAAFATGVGAVWDGRSG